MNSNCTAKRVGFNSTTCIFSAFKSQVPQVPQVPPEAILRSVRDSSAVGWVWQGRMRGWHLVVFEDDSNFWSTFFWWWKWRKPYILGHLGYPTSIKLPQVAWIFSRWPRPCADATSRWILLGHPEFSRLENTSGTRMCSSTLLIPRLPENGTLRFPGILICILILKTDTENHSYSWSLHH